MNLDVGGLERLIVDLARRVGRETFESHVLCLQRFGREAENLGDVAELHLAPPLPPHTLLFPGRLARTIARLRPDVVHTHSGVWFKAARAARRAGVRRILHTEHGRPYPDPPAARLFDGLAARRTDVIVAVSPDLAHRLERTLHVDPDRIVVVRNGVDTDRFRPGTPSGAFRRELGIGGGVPLIGSAGRLDPVKGYDVMLEALVRLRSRWRPAPEPELVLLGDGPEGPRLRSRASDLGLDGAVHWLGWRHDVPELLRSLDLFTLSSWSEGTSLSLLEAMSSGLCPVVTDVGGNADVLGERLRHRLVPAGDPERLATAWEVALREPEERARDGSVARQRVLDAFSLERMVRRYEALYRGQEPMRGGVAGRGPA